MRKKPDTKAFVMVMKIAYVTRHPMRITELHYGGSTMEKLCTVEVRRKAKIDDEWRIVDQEAKAVVSADRVRLFLDDDTAFTFRLDDPRTMWLETEKGEFMGAFIRTSTYERDGIEITTEWEYVVRSI